MKLVYTTTTTVENLRSLAKARRKSHGTPQSQGREAVAREHGYEHWKHVIECANATRDGLVLRPLPAGLVDLQAVIAAQYAPEDATRRARSDGLMFALDVKDAEAMAPNPHIVECEDAWPLVLEDIMRILAAEKGTSGRARLDDVGTDDLRIFISESLWNYRLFRSTREDVPVDLNGAFGTDLGRLAFPPIFVWLHGRFIDMETVEEVVVNGERIYASNSTGAGRLVSYSPLASEEAAVPEADGTIHFQRRDEGMIFRLDISQLEPGVYEASASYSGESLMESSHYPSLREAIHDASFTTGEVAGYEIAYEALVVGTYDLHTMATQPELIARQAVATRSRMQGL